MSFFPLVDLTPTFYMVCNDGTLR